MARLDERLSHNAPGDFYVDGSCIDCDTCRWMAPETFTRREDQSSVAAQPTDDAQTRAALQALIACPTASIGVTERHDLRVVQASFPIPVTETSGGSRVLHCGYHAESSFGATSYLIVREGGNVLVDSPRFSGPLVKRIEQLGGVATLFLTHRDDVADHARFAARFGCERVLHADDVTRGTSDVERQIEGDTPVQLADDLLVIPTPGHTQGSACLLHHDVLFTGDHLAWSARLGHLYAFRTACWFDWDVQIEAMIRLATHDFAWVLPGHGRRAHLPVPAMRADLQRCIEWMRSG